MPCETETVLGRVETDEAVENAVACLIAVISMPAPRQGGQQKKEKPRFPAHFITELLRMRTVGRLGLVRACPGFPVQVFQRTRLITKSTANEMVNSRVSSSNCPRKYYL